MKEKIIITIIAMLLNLGELFINLAAECEIKASQLINVVEE